MSWEKNFPKIRFDKLNSVSAIGNFTDDATEIEIEIEGVYKCDQIFEHLLECGYKDKNLEKQNKELVEALRFYANTESWCDPHEPYDSSSIGSNDCEEWDMGNMKPDNVGGKLARKTLKKLGIE